MEAVRSFFGKYGRYLLGLIGIVAIVVLVQKVGPAKVWGILVAAGPWLPLILLLDWGWMATESGALLLLYGPEAKQVRGRDWIRSVFVHFATFVVVPVGRVSAEVARATALAPRVGRTRAAAGAALMQSLTLCTNALFSVGCLSVVLITTRHPATSTLMSANILVTGILGVGLYLVLRHVQLGGWLSRRFRKLSVWGPEIDHHVRANRGRHLSALLVCVAARLVQTIQFGVIFHAVAGSWDASMAVVAQGIQMAGRSMGDAVPNQIGVTEGAFALGAGALGLSGVPERAVAIALMVRVSNLSVAGLSAVALQFLPRPGPPTPLEPDDALTEMQAR